MPSTADIAGPSYISSHSADVILSEIRPIKLKIEALRSINVLLDEFLYSILSTACSLSTDKLRTSLLSLLPTTLGKEALLEAEVELRAYWDRTGPTDAVVPSIEDDTKTFHLKWSFELLRLKCEAYSTLNESDEDPEAEERINVGMSSTGATPPKAVLMAPAALYLTAILEALCEHILSNIGRVASRDSSRNSATVQDLFVALCEDHSIYGLFKAMKVYEQIEKLSKAPKVRRSKSLTRNDSHTSSPHQDLSTVKDGLSAQSRPSSDTSGATTTITTSSSVGSRSSFEKTKAMKMFKTNSRSSTDRDGVESQSSHKKSDSVGDYSRRTTTPNLEDQVMLQEFDDLMRSSATMKVSLTPDRLKTMEAYYKQERDNRRPSFKAEPDPSVLPPRATVRRSSLLRVNSIKEDEEDNTTKSSLPPLPTYRNDQVTVNSPLAASRARSVSTSSAMSRVPLKLSHMNTSPISVPSSPVNSVPMQHHRRVMQGQDPFPPRTRQIQRNRESIDLDDLMGASDDEIVPETRAKPLRSPNSSARIGHHGVSAGTKDLMDFLAEGPPDLGGPMTGLHPDRNLAPNGSAENGKSKGPGKLQRVMSLLSLGNAEKIRVAETSPRQADSTISSAGTLSSLANRPIPPRPPRPVSPVALSEDPFSDQSYDGPLRTALPEQNKQKSTETRLTETSPPITTQREHSSSFSSNRRPSNPNVNGHVHNNRNGRAEGSSTTSPVRVVNVPKSDNPMPSSLASPTMSQGRVHQNSPGVSPPRKPVPIYVTTPSEPYISRNDAQDIHRLLSKATNADECRLIFDMFLTKSGIAVESTGHSVSPPPSLSSLVAREEVRLVDVGLEHSIVELFLGGDDTPEQGVHKQRPQKHGKIEASVTEQHHYSGSESQNTNGTAENEDLHDTSRDLDGTRDFASPLRSTQNYTLVSVGT